MPVETTARVAVRNDLDRPLLLIYEPWCQTYELAPAEENVLEATSPRPGWLVVEYGVDAVTVYAWDACVGRVYDVAGHLLDSLDIRVPDFTALDQQSKAEYRDDAV